TDTDTDLSYAEFKFRAQHEAFRSVMAIPLVTVATAPSVLVLYKNIPYHYSYSERELAVSFANYASLALENATLYGYSDEQARIQTSRLEAIVDSLSEALILESESHEIVYMNSQAYKILHLQAPPRSPKDILNHLMQDVIAPTNA